MESDCAGFLEEISAGSGDQTTKPGGKEKKDNKTRGPKHRKQSHAVPKIGQEEGGWERKKKSK